MSEPIPTFVLSSKAYNFTLTNGMNFAASDEDSLESKMLDEQNTLLQAVAAHQNGDLATAKKIYQDLIVRFPRNGDGYHNIGLIYQSQNEYQTANGYFEKALDCDRKTKQFWISKCDNFLLNGELEAANSVLSDAKLVFRSDPELDELSHKVNSARSKRHGLVEEFCGQQASRGGGLSKAQIELLQNSLNSQSFERAIVQALDFLRSGKHDAILYAVLGLAFNALENQEISIVCYKKSIKLNPRDVNSHYNLGNAYKNVGQLKEAVASYKTAIKLNRKFRGAYINLVSTLFKLVKYQDALNVTTKAMKVLDSADIKLLHGKALMKAGKLSDSLRWFELLSDGNAETAETKIHALCNVINIHLYQSQSVHLPATVHKLESYKDLTNEASLTLAKYYVRSQQFDNAKQHLSMIDEASTKLFDVSFNAGQIYENLGEEKEAFYSYSRAAKLPYTDVDNVIELIKYFKAHRHFSTALEICHRFNKQFANVTEVGILNAQVLSELGRKDEALDLLKTLYTAEPNDAAVVQALSAQYLLDHNVVRASELIKEAYSLAPQSAQVNVTYGNILNSLGETNQALQKFKNSIDFDPASPSGYFNYFQNTKYSEERDFELLQRLLDLKSSGSKKLGPLGAASVNFTLAKMNHDTSHYATAFGYYCEGNKHKSETVPYKIERHKVMVDHLKEVFLNQTVGLHEFPKSPVAPIFIVGMPRSGTTLLEQIISSHSTVSSGGELDFANIAAGGIRLNSKTLKDTDLANFRNAYLKSFEAFRAKLNLKGDYTTDKAPTNFLHIGYILESIPEAKVINIYRNAQATCWSNFTKNFSGGNVPFSNDLLSLTEFYNLYCEIMTFWHKQFPNQIIDINYEDLTTNQEEMSRDLFNTLDLNWEDQVLDFHRNKSTVRTASISQVRKKMYQGSSETWRKYQEFLPDHFLNMETYRSKAAINISAK